METKIISAGPGEFREGAIPKTVTVEHNGEQIELSLGKVMPVSPTFAMVYYTKHTLLCHQCGTEK